MKCLNKVIGCFVIGFATILATSAIRAEQQIYWWVPDGSTWASFADPTNWRMGSESGEAAVTCPSAEDMLADKRTMRFNMGGVTNEVAQWDALSDWGTWNLYLTNGCLKINTKSRLHHGEIKIYNDGCLLFPSGSFFAPGQSSGVERSMTVYDGGSFIFDDAEIYVWNYKLDIRKGGYAYFKPSRLRTDSGNRINTIFNSGTLDIPSGISAQINNSDSRFTIEQKEGVLNLGGDLTYNDQGLFNVRFNGGSVHIVSNASVHATSATVAADADLTIDVDEGMFFDMSSFDINVTARIDKRGKGYIGLGYPFPTGLVLSEGGLALVAAGETYDLSDIPFGSQGGSIMLNDAGITLTGDAPEGVTFVANLSEMKTNFPFVTCEDGDLRAKIMADLNANAPEGLGVIEDGDALFVVVKTEYVFNSTTSTDWFNPDAWECGFVPEGVDVQVEGNGVVAILDKAPNVKSISITRDAKVVVAWGAGVTNELPHIKMSLNSELAIDSGVAMMTNGLLTIATDQAIPVVSVAKGAWLAINQATQLKNVDLKVYGTIEQTELGHLILGTANEGETTYFGLTADEADFVIAGYQDNYDKNHLRIACPTSGGTVIAPNEMAMRSFRIILSSGNMNGFDFGRNNPKTIPLRLVCTDTYFIGNEGGNPYQAWRLDSKLKERMNWRMDSGFSIGGNAQLVLSSGCIWETDWNVWWKWGGFQMYDRGQLRLENGGTYNQYHTSGRTGLYSWEQDWPAVVVGNGGVFQMSGAAGNGATIYRIEDGGMVKLCYPHGFEGHYNTTLFEGAKAVEIPEGATATICGCVNDWRAHNKYLTNNVPFIGGGNLVITNTYVSTPTNFFFYQNAPCSITGTLKVADDCRAKFIFNSSTNWNGAVCWGGTVYTKNVELDRGEYVVVTNSFGGLCLEDDWEMVIADDSTYDFLEVGAGGFSGEGKLVFKVSDDVNIGSSMIIGSMPSTLSELPKISLPGYRVAISVNEEDDSIYELALKKRGFSVIIR